MRDSKKMKAAKAAAVTAAAAGIMTGALFDTPADLLPDLVSDSAVEETAEDSGAPQEKRRGPAERLRGWILDLPAAVRMLVGLPLWCIGWVLMTGISALVGTAAVPMERIVSWICLSAILLAVFTLSVKSAFPKVPVREILRGRNVLFLTVTALLLGLADLALPTVWAGYNIRTQIVWRVGAGCVLLFACVMTLAHHGKKVAQSRELTQEEIRDAARRLADTITPGSF